MSEGDDTQRLRLKPQMDLDDASEFEALKKQAFRIAFDFYSKCFPPTQEEEYWDGATELMTKIIEENKTNPLVHFLIVAVVDYLSFMAKDLPKEDA